MVAILLPFWPGLISPDTNMTLYEATSGVNRDWYSPFLSSLWGLLLDLNLGVGSIFVLQTTILVAGGYLCSRCFFGLVPAAVTTAALCVFPPFYAHASGISRDTYSTGLALMCFGLLGRASAAVGRQRGGFATGAAIAAVLSFLARQNAIVIVFALVVALTWLALTHPAWRPTRFEAVRRLRTHARRGALALSVGVMACALLFVSVVSVYRLNGVLAVHPERQLYVYDLAAISSAVDEDFFPRELDDLPRNAIPRDLSLSAIEARFDFRNVIYLYPDWNWLVGDLNDEAAGAAETELLRDAWAAAIVDEPVAYVSNRARLMLSQLGISGRPLDGYMPMIGPDNYGHPLQFERGYRAASSYIDLFVGPTSVLPLDLAWIYLVAGTVSGVCLIRRLRPSLLPVVVMLASVWFGLASLAFTAMASSFRYMALVLPISFSLTSVALAHLARNRTETGLHVVLDSGVHDERPDPAFGSAPTSAAVTPSDRIEPELVSAAADIARHEASAP